MKSHIDLNESWPGLALIAFGAVLLIGSLLDVNVWRFLWPFALIGVGLWLIFKQSKDGKEPILIGEVNRRGAWQAEDERFSMFIGDISLDLRQADLPTGQTHLTFSSFIGDIDLTLPEDVGVSVQAAGFISDLTLRGESTTHFFSPTKLKSANFPTSDRQLIVHVSGFISDITIT